MTSISQLSNYYDHIEKIALDISKEVIEWHKEHGEPSVEARYLVETAYRISKNQIYQRKSTLPNINLDPISTALRYLELLKDHLDEFLSGEIKGSEIIKKGGYKLWTEFNRGNPLMDIFSHKVADKVRPLIANNDILELGGGVGGTTTALKEDLKRANSFVFTDIKTYFLESIKNELPDVPLSTEILNLKKPPDNFPTFDLIFATNVIHVVSDIESTLKWIKSRLNPNGDLILGEGSPYSKTCPWPLELMFSMFEGWHNILRFDHRPFPGWLLPEQWLNFFSLAGFNNLNMNVMMDDKRLFGGIYQANK